MGTDDAQGTRPRPRFSLGTGIALGTVVRQRMNPSGGAVLSGRGSLQIGRIKKDDWGTTGVVSSSEVPAARHLSSEELGREKNFLSRTESGVARYLTELLMDRKSTRLNSSHANISY